MTVTRISTGSRFEAQIGYSRAVAVDGWVFGAGTAGYDYGAMTMPEAVTDQCRNALSTIADALAQTGASLDDVVRINYYLAASADWEACWPIVSQAFAIARPAATMIRAELQFSDMKIDIEVTTRCPVSPPLDV